MVELTFSSNRGCASGMRAAIMAARRNHPWVFKKFIRFAFNSSARAVQVSCTEACLYEKGFLVFSKITNVLWMIIGCHRSAFLRVTWDVVPFVERRLNPLTGCSSKSWADRVLILPNNGHRLIRTLFCLNQCRRAFVWLEVDEVVVSAGKVNTGNLPWVEAFWVRAKDSVKIGVHGLRLNCFWKISASRGAQETCNVSTSAAHSCWRALQVK